VEPQSEIEFGGESHGFVGTSGTIQYAPEKFKGDAIPRIAEFFWSNPRFGNIKFESKVFEVEKKFLGSYCEVDVKFTGAGLVTLETLGEVGLAGEVTDQKFQLEGKGMFHARIAFNEVHRILGATFYPEPVPLVPHNESEVEAINKSDSKGTNEVSKQEGVQQQASNLIETELNKEPQQETVKEAPKALDTPSHSLQKDLSHNTSTSNTNESIPHSPVSNDLEVKRLETIMQSIAEDKRKLEEEKKQLDGLNQS